MNTQEAYTKACEYLMQAEGRSGIADCPPGGGDAFVCLYAGPDDRACGVGCLLPRELAARLDTASGSSVSPSWGAVLRNPEEFPAYTEAAEYLKGVSNDMLYHLQGIHDSRLAWEHGKGEMKRRLHKLARDFGLTAPECLGPDLWATCDDEGGP